MKKKVTSIKSTETSKRKQASKPEPGNETPRRFLKIARRDREQLKEHYGPKIAPLIEEAGDLIARTEFCQKDKWRKVPAPLGLGEIDFQSLESSDLEFSVFWEYAREVRALYQEVLIPVPTEGDLVLPWIKLGDFFPLPIVRIKREGLFNHEASEQDASRSEKKRQHQPGFKEFDPTNLKFFLEVYQAGYERIPDEIVGIGPMSFAKVLNLASKSPGAHISYHAVGIDWSQGIAAIKADFNRWIDTRLEQYTKDSPADVFKKSKRAISREVKLSKLALAQLAAWRAKRSGMNAKQYLEFRVKAFAPDFAANSGRAVGGTERMELKAKALSDKIDTPIYLRSEEFNEAEARLAIYASKLARFDPSNITVSVPK